MTDDDDGILGPGQVRDLYGRLAPSYDLLASVYRGLGSSRLVEDSIAVLGLRAGDTVLDLGCGTGEHLPRLARAVAPGGRVVGVDLSGAMLARARDRTTSPDVDVVLIEGDVRDVAYPDDLAGVLSTFALEMVPGYDAVIAGAAEALASRRGRLAVVGLREPEGWPRWAVRAGMVLSRPFGVREEYTRFRPWESVRRHLHELRYDTVAAGAIYRCVGEAR